MTEQSGEITFIAQPTEAQLAAVRIEKTIPDVYRLIGRRTDNGFTELRLQGYFTWTQSLGQRGGEWRDIETVDADDPADDKPYGKLY